MYFNVKHRCRRHAAFNPAAHTRQVRFLSAPPLESPGVSTFWPQAYFFAAFAFFSSKAACAAASRAMGTRKGEQLT